MTINLPFLCSNAIDSITDIYFKIMTHFIVLSLHWTFFGKKRKQIFTKKNFVDLLLLQI